MIKYIGSKRRMVDLIGRLVDALPGVETVLDLFSGTSRVGRALKARGYRVIANDHNAYAWVVARCYVEADARAMRSVTPALLRDLAETPPHDGWFTETFCRNARFFRPENGARIEGIRRRIQEEAWPSDVEGVLLTALMEAADRVDSTTGVQMAYLKQWAPRALNALDLRHPDLIEGEGVALLSDAVAAAGHPADLVYLDPPYNQHSYLSNYHVWETLVRYDNPEAYGIAQKRVDCRTRKSAFNRRATSREAMAAVLARVQARHVVVSFNDEGYLDRETLTDLLAPHGEVCVLSVSQSRYVGARIGIHNLKGEKVGKVGKLKNRELLFIASHDTEALEGLEERLLEPTLFEC